MTAIETDEHGRRIYRPDGETLRAYIADESHVSIICGPIGSGTSTASCMKIFKIGMSQTPSPVDGVRRTRWAIVRSTYPELIGTTLETWLTWFPEELYGRLNRSRPMRQAFKVGDVEMDVWFLALDGTDDIKKLRSAEFTGIWFNELEYHDKAIFDEAESRTGRYPSVMQGGARWHGVIADMNAPTEDHWVPRMLGDVPLPDDIPEEERAAWKWPQDWAFFRQPPALLEIMGDDGKTVVDYVVNPKAENVRWLKQGFYDEKRRGKSRTWIDSRLMNRVTVYSDGKPVWPNFKVETHVSQLALTAHPNYPLIIGVDFGRRPAAVICQIVNNRFRVLSEFRGYDMGATTYAPMLKRFLAQRYPGFKFQMYGDPKGNDKGQAGERTAYDIFRANGLPIQAAPCPTNNIAMRLEAVECLLNEMYDGLPRFVIDPVSAPTLKVAMSGKYCYRKLPNGGYDDEPLKTGKDAKYSDIADALQYAALGAGEGRKLVGISADSAPRHAKVAKRASVGGRRVA